MKIIKNSQNGRSMVEMLGVLAIIGVLSVGAVAGYSKAMFKHKINKTTDEISNIVANTRSVFNNNEIKDGYELGVHIGDEETIKKLNIIPENMWKGNDIINSFGGEVGIVISKFLSIHYHGLSSQACIELATRNWNINDGIILVGACGEGCDTAILGDAYNETQEDMKEIFKDHDHTAESYTFYWEGVVSVERATQGCSCSTNTCELMLGYKI